MIITEPLTINEKSFTKTYSDSGFYIEHDGEKYSEAIDPSEFGRTYTETDIPVEAADYLDHLISIGIDVTDFENEVISE